MNLSNQSLLVILIVGIVAGWLAGRLMEGGGFGLSAIGCCRGSVSILALGSSR
jgi:uncharacterized membrane protein YeaQ/YmgE (transglycosylase-associated protein family)